MMSREMSAVRSQLEALALPSLPAEVDLDTVVVSEHAVQRYQERVERVPRTRALRRVQALAAEAGWERRPRRWMTIDLQDHTFYGYPLHRPDVCLLLRYDRVVTVLSRKYLEQVSPSRGRQVART